MYCTVLFIFLLCNVSYFITHTFLSTQCVVQYSTVQYSTVQYSTVQYSIVTYQKRERDRRIGHISLRRRASSSKNFYQFLLKFPSSINSFSIFLSHTTIQYRPGLVPYLSKSNYDDEMKVVHMIMLHTGIYTCRRFLFHLIIVHTVR